MGFMEINLLVILVGIVLVFFIGYGMVFRFVMLNYFVFFYSKGRVKVGV